MEKYGTVPKKFTHEWWEYFWMYYKVYVIIAIFVIITASVTIYQIVTAPKYDLTITYAGGRSFSTEIEDEMLSAITPMCKDVDGNKKKSINFSQINMNTADEMHNVNMENKLILALGEQDIFIYILDPEVAGSIISSKDQKGFIPVNDWVKGDTSEMNKYEKFDVAYGVELTDCETFRKIADKTGADFSGNYLFVRYPRPDQTKEQDAAHEAAVELATKIVRGY